MCWQCANLIVKRYAQTGTVYSSINIGLIRLEMIRDGQTLIRLIQHILKAQLYGRESHENIKSDLSMQN